MRTMQDKILSEIDEIVQSYELELVVSYAASNTGKLYIMDGLDLVCSYTFDFQSSYFSLHIYHGIHEAGAVKKHLIRGSGLQIKPHETQEIKRILQFLDDYLREHDMEKNEVI